MCQVYWYFSDCVHVCVCVCVYVLCMYILCIPPQGEGGVKLTIFTKVPRWRMSGVVRLLPCIPLWPSQWQLYLCASVRAQPYVLKPNFNNFSDIFRTLCQSDDFSFASWCFEQDIIIYKYQHELIVENIFLVILINNHHRHNHHLHVLGN